MALTSSRFTWPGWPASAIGRSCPAAISRTTAQKACCSSVSANAVTGLAPGCQRAAAVTGPLPGASGRARCAVSRT